jgi:serpin B
VQMPRWTFRSAVIDLKAPLKALRMKFAFAPYQAVFSGMDGSRRLFISSVVHQASVAVDEAGTEAAAATAVSVGVTSAAPPTISFVVDQPFV